MRFPRRLRSALSLGTMRGLPRGLMIGTLCLAAGVAFLWQSLVSAKPVPPTAEDRMITRYVALISQRKHLIRPGIDDEAAKRCLTGYLKILDPYKLYFYQTDVDEFVAEQNRIDDLIKRRGDVQLAHRIFNRFLARVKERLQQIETALATEHDFTIDEEITRDPDAATYPKTSEEAAERWRKRIKFDLLLLTADDVTMDKALEKLQRRYTNFAKRMEQTDHEEVLEMYLTSLTTGFDPHSTYMSPAALENFFIQISLQLEGIGASLTVEDGFTVIKKIIPGGAADKDGQLKVEDKIVGVGQGEGGEIVDVVDMKLNDVVQQIRGKAGTVVRLEVLTGDGTDREIYDITRAKIELKDSEARSRIISGNTIAAAGRGEDGKPEPVSNVVPAGVKPDGTPYLIGVIDLPSFYMDMEGARRGLENYKRTSVDVRRLLAEFTEKNVDVVVVDLRRNGGGSLKEAVDTTGLFIDKGPVVTVKDFEGRETPSNDRDPGVAWDGPLVVLTSKLSASASEIFAGAIQDYDRGIIVGDKTTHGKGTVQQLFPIGQEIYHIDNARNLGALKLTIQQFFLPSGDSTQNRGVLADVELPWLMSHWSGGEAELDYAIDFSRVEPMPHDDYNLVDDQMIARLRGYSEARWRASEDFARDRKKIERFKALKETKTRTLNREKFLAERAEFDAGEEQMERLADAIDGTDDVIFDTEDYYNAEVLAIALDYLRLLNGRTVPPMYLAD